MLFTEILLLATKSENKVGPKDFSRKSIPKSKLVKVKCFAQEHSTVTLAKTQNHIN